MAKEMLKIKFNNPLTDRNIIVLSSLILLLGIGFWIFETDKSNRELIAQQQIELTRMGNLEKKLLTDKKLKIQDKYLQLIKKAIYSLAIPEFSSKTLENGSTVFMFEASIKIGEQSLSEILSELAGEEFEYSIKSKDNKVEVIFNPKQKNTDNFMQLFQLQYGLNQRLKILELLISGVTKQKIIDKIRLLFLEEFVGESQLKNI